MKEWSIINSVSLINGVPIVGWGEGDDVLQMRRSNPAYGHKTGVDGAMGVFRNGDQSGEVIIRVLQMSETNAYLSGLFNSSENLGLVGINFQFKDLANQSVDLVTGPVGYLENHAEMIRGGDVNEQSWTFRFEKLIMAAGGPADIVVSAAP